MIVSNKKVWGAWAVLVLLLLTACSSSDGDQTTAAVDNGGTLIKSQNQRITNPQIGADALSRQVTGNTEFAFDLYRAVNGNGDNLIFSPYSISLALAMTYAGAAGETAQEMAGTLHFVLPDTELHPAFNALDLALASRGRASADSENKPFKLNIANSIWGQSGYNFKEPFLDTLAENYGAGLRTLDFVAAPESAREVINNLISEETEDKIKDLIPEGAISSSTRLVLSNAVYFNASWAHPFEESATQAGSFYLLDGTTKNINFMAKTEFFGYSDGQDYQAIELPYDGYQLAMLLIVPDAGKFTAVEDRLDSALLSDIEGGLAGTNVSLQIPKFKFDADLGLKDTLTSLGMAEAFEPGIADFSGMDGTNNLFVSDVLHKAFIAVDEAGTEAAAATAVIVGVTSMPASPVSLVIDRPFIFLIQDQESGVVLFLGRVTNP